MNKRDILYVDDMPSDLMDIARSATVDDRIAEFESDHLSDDQNRTKSAAKGSNLWIFDFFNDDSQRLSPDLSREGFASNGLAVFHQLRLVIGDSRPPAMVVSNHLEQAVGREVNLQRRHIIAEQLGVDWIARKSESAITEAISIADAFEELIVASDKLSSRDGDYSENLAVHALALPQPCSWQRTAIRDVNHHRPPSWRMGARSARELLAWLLRHVIPYPTFIINDRHIAARFGLQLDCLRQAMEAETPLRQELISCRYLGALSHFGGQRWWSAGIDALIADLPRKRTERLARLTQLVSPIELRFLDFDDPVVTSDAELVEQDRIADASTCVRVADENFPPEVPEAWVPIELVRNDKNLMSKVKLEDLASIPEVAN